MKNSLGKYIAVVAFAILFASNIIVFMSLLHDNIFGYYSSTLQVVFDNIILFMMLVRGILWYAFVYFGYFEGKKIRKRYKVLMLLSLMLSYTSAYGYALIQNIEKANFLVEDSIIGILLSTSNIILVIILFIMLIMLLINKLSDKSMTVLMIVAAIFYVFFEGINTMYEFWANPIYGIYFGLWILSFIPISLLLVALFFQHQRKLKVFLIIALGYVLLLKSFNFIVFFGSHSTLMVVTNTFIIIGYILLLITTVMFKVNKGLDNEK